jgi:hypothetical protein
MPNVKTARSHLKPALLVLGILSTQVLAADEHPPEGYKPGISLPDGEGRVLLESACTRCHDLKGLEAYKGYWNQTRWRSMVETMVRNGAKLDESQMTVVTDYLTLHFGPGTRESK